MPSKNEQSKSGPTGEALETRLNEAFGPESGASFGKGNQVVEIRAEPPAGPMIYAKLAAVMAELPAVGKNSVNEQQGWNFRGVDAVVNAISPALRNHGVVVVPSLEQCVYRDAQTTNGKPTREVTVQVRYTFYAADGSNVSAVVPGESLDQSDKGSAKAMSVAFRIVLLQVFALPTSEPDPDASYHTRDGIGAMSASVRDLLLTQVPDAPADGLGPLWAIVLEHSAAERRISDAAITWADYFAQRIAELIGQVGTWEQGVALKRSLENQGLTHLRFQDSPAHALLAVRAALIKERATTAFNYHMGAINAASALEELEIAEEALEADFLTYVITSKQKMALLDVAGDKRAKLERELNQAAPTEPNTAPGYDHLDELAAAGGIDAVIEPSGADDGE